MISYQYTAYVDGAVLSTQIRALGLPVPLRYVNTDGDQVTIYFDDWLSEGDKSRLDAAVAAHDPNTVVTTPLPVTVQTAPPPSPFASKLFGAKKLFKRVHGIRVDCLSGQVSENIYIVPYAWTKITGVEIVGAALGTTASFYVHDSDTGIATGGMYPNLMLNQFAFDVNIAAGFYQHISEYDADLYGGMKIRVAIRSSDDRQVGVNFILNEVK